jgi:hypothetical protein
MDPDLDNARERQLLEVVDDDTRDDEIDFGFPRIPNQRVEHLAARLFQIYARRRVIDVAERVEIIVADRNARPMPERRPPLEIQTARFVRH